MKTLFITFLLALQCTLNWGTDFEAAKQEAKASNKLILIYFSGSDWCPHCMKMKKDIYESKAFNDYAAKNLVLVNADFPRKKKNQLPADQAKRNDELAAKYDPKGSYPYTVIVNSDGKVLKEWEGATSLTPEQFIGEISKLNASASN